MKPTQRERFVEWCMRQEDAGALYVWNADGEMEQTPDGNLVPTFDCSGFVLSGFKAVGLPDWTKTRWSQRMFDTFEPTEEPQRGDLAFYGRDPHRVSHVVVCLGGKDGPIIGANGGDQNTINVAEAIRRNARVKRYHSPKYRADFQGFRKSPFADEAQT